jgi:Flp pilus assembly pilin Flp
MIQRFWEDESGPEMVEWAVVTIILLVATMPVIMMLRDTLIETFKSIFLFLEEDSPDTWVP